MTPDELAKAYDEIDKKYEKSIHACDTMLRILLAVLIFGWASFMVAIIRLAFS